MNTRLTMYQKITLIILYISILGCASPRQIELIENAYSPIIDNRKSTRVFSYPPPEYQLEVIEWKNKGIYWALTLKKNNQDVLFCEFTGSKTLEIITAKDGHNILIDKKDKNISTFRFLVGEKVIIKFDCIVVDNNNVKLDFLDPKQ
jgi:hypothetical protein